MVDAFIAHFFSDNCIYTKQKQISTKPVNILVCMKVTLKGASKECFFLFVNHIPGVEFWRRNTRHPSFRKLPIDHPIPPSQKYGLLSSNSFFFRYLISTHFRVLTDKQQTFTLGCLWQTLNQLIFYGFRSNCFIELKVDKKYKSQIGKIYDCVVSENSRLSGQDRHAIHHHRTITLKQEQ